MSLNIVKQKLIVAFLIFRLSIKLFYLRQGKYIEVMFTEGFYMCYISEI